MASRKKHPKKKTAQHAKKRAQPAKKKAIKKAAAPKPLAKRPAPKKTSPAPHPRKRAVRRRAPPGPQRKLGRSPYDSGLDRNPANYQPLTPLTHLERAASTYPDTVAVIHGKARLTYRDFYARCRRLASALAKKGIRKGDTVAVMLSNTPPMLEAHYGIPMLGAVLNALNTRLDPAAVAFMLEHGGARILITDREYSATVATALNELPYEALCPGVDALAALQKRYR